MVTRLRDYFGKNTLKKALFQLAWKRVPSWECLYVHKDQGLFLSVYVDDFKMVGRSSNMEAMWKKIGKLLTLEPETDLFNNVYLGCNQTEEPADHKYVHEKMTYLEGSLRLKSNPKQMQLKET